MSLIGSAGKVGQPLVFCRVVAKVPSTADEAVAENASKADEAVVQNRGIDENIFFTEVRSNHIFFPVPRSS